MRALLIAAALLPVSVATAAADEPAADEARTYQLAADLWAFEPPALVEVGLDGLAGDLVALRHPKGYELKQASPAVTALGLKQGDIVTSINGVALDSRAAVEQAYLASRGSDWVEVALIRGGSPITFRYRAVSDLRNLESAAYEGEVLADLLKLLAPGVSKSGAGYQIDQLVLETLGRRQLLSSRGVDRVDDGLLVLTARGPLNLLGLEPFDRIDAINGEPPRSPAGLRRAFADAARAAEMTIALDRRGKPVTLRYQITTGKVDSAALTRDLEQRFPAAPDRPTRASKLDPAIAAGIVKVGPNEYTITRATVDAVLANPTAFARGARIVPSIKNGKPNGFKLYAIRPASIYGALGLKNGDTIHSINGMDISSPDKALAVYSQLRRAKKVELEITRRGKKVAHIIRIVK